MIESGGMGTAMRRVWMSARLSAREVCIPIQKSSTRGLSEFYRQEYGLDSIALRVNLSYGPYIMSSFQPFSLLLLISLQ